MIFEWNALKGQLFQKSKAVKTSQEVLEGWQMLIKTAPETIATILELVKLILTISVSTAEVERGFSSLNRIKTSQRSIMSQECLRSHLMINRNTPEVGIYDASETNAMDKWSNVCRRRPAK